MSFSFKKSLGQNFLKDNNIINKISNSINPNKDDLIIEIGPGAGALTKELVKKGSDVICFEIDERLKEELYKIEEDNLKIIFNDFLKININEYIDKKYKRLFFVGNLPYYITTPIIKHVISEELDVDKMIFMVQDEVADRFCANPKTKDYSSITLYLKYYFNVKKLFKVSKNSFNPVPKVDSAILEFNKRIDKPKVDKEKYFKLIEDSFKMKRKTLKNNLHDYDFNKVESILNKYNIPNTVRAEELSEDILIDIANNS
jgi:16S rRNA (adenine1518-N6/adenine1519-N6)-dimethyltransferase